MNQNELEVKYTDDVLEKFRNHIDLEHNQNILFSGKYGTGKTTFLGHFFKNNPAYHSIRLTPVNYVVSSNENIFELIKVDIIKQLHEDGFIQFDKQEELKIDKVSAAIHYALNKPLDFTKHVVSALSKLHPVLEVATSGVKGVHAFIKDLVEYENKLNAELKSKNQILVEHAEKHEGVIGSYFEFDIISKILKSTLDEIKKENTKTVLIIDDLDRLDPEHIFRILNIFSSHNSPTDNRHKLGFEKVIIVADINNIEVLFKHRYGNKAEFNGYIDKFYSDQIFNFSNREAIKYFIKHELKIDFRNHEQNVLSDILSIFLDANVLTIRNIIKYRNFRQIVPFQIGILDLTNNDFEPIPHIQEWKLWFDSDDCQIVYVIAILTSIFGSYKNLKEAITHFLKEGKFFEYSSNQLIFDYLESFALPIRLFRTNGNLELYFGVHNKYDNFRKENITGLDGGYPRGSCFDIIYKQNLRWNRGNPYKGETSFFQNSKIVLDSNSKLYLHTGMTIKHLESIISLIESRNMMNQLNICVE